jgi:uncharacterized protein DUF5906
MRAPSITPPRPTTHTGTLDPLPVALRRLVEHKRWCTWKWELITKKDGTTAWTKPPYQGNSPQHKAKNNNPGTWCHFRTALSTMKDRRRGCDGIGLMLLDGDIAALDLDKCRNPETKQLTPWAQALVDRALALRAYVEETVSGRGMRILGIGEGGQVHRKWVINKETDEGIEAFRSCARFITVSGLQVGSCSALPNIDALVDEVIATYDAKPKANAKANSADLSSEQFQELLISGTVNGVAPEHTGAACHSAVWHLAAQGKGLDEIVALLRKHPNGIAAKFLTPSDRLDKEVARSFTKYNDNIPPVISTWNERHAHVLAGGKSAVLQEFKSDEGYTDFKLLSSHTFNEWNAEHHMQIGTNAQGQPITVPISKYWLRHPKRRKYEDIGFYPQRDVPHYYNLWRGFAVEPRKGDCSKFLAHLRDNVAQGEEAYYNWVEAWFADIFQHPGTKCDTSLVFRGGQGVGKTFVAKVIGYLLGVHYKLVADSRYVTGRFNAHMISLLMLAADEAFWAGDKSAEGKLKDLITGDRHPIEFKGKDAFWVRNFARLLVCGNHDWQVPAAFDERRFAVFDVGNAHQRDVPYFAAIDAEMKNGGYEALLYHFLNEVDCSAVNLREIPKTDALMEQKIESATSEQVWLIDILCSGRLPGDDGGNGVSPSEVLFDHYIEHAKNRGYSRRQIETTLGMFLHKMISGLIAQREIYSTMIERTGRLVSRRALVYRFPPLKDCRASFCQRIGSTIEWPDDIKVWSAIGL